MEDAEIGTLADVALVAPVMVEAAVAVEVEVEGDGDSERIPL